MLALGHRVPMPKMILGQMSSKMLKLEEEVENRSRPKVLLLSHADFDSGVHLPDSHLL